MYGCLYINACIEASCSRLKDNRVSGIVVPASHHLKLNWAQARREGSWRAALHIDVSIFDCIQCNRRGAGKQKHSIVPEVHAQQAC